MATAKVGFITIVRGTFDTGYAGTIRTQIKDLLAHQLELIDCPTPVATAADAAAVADTLPLADIGAIVVLQATFADGSVISEIAQKTGRGIVVWGIPEQPAEPGTTPRLALNSLCGINLAAHSLHRIGAAYSCVFGPPTAKTVEQVVRQAKAFSAVQHLQGTRLLALGDAPQGFYPSEYDVEELQRTFGVSVERMPLAEVFARANAVDSHAVEKAAQDIAGELPGFTEVDAGQAEKSIRAYLAMRNYIRENNIAATAVECWPRFMTEYGGAACFMLSRLNDHGIMAACETDVNGAITMLLQHYLTGSASFFSDLVQVDEASNTGVFWHCGAAPATLAGSGGAHAGVQPNRKVGVAMNFALKGGDVTVAKIGRNRQGFSLFVAKGTAIDEPLRFLGNTLRVRFAAPVQSVLDTIFTHGLDHHYAVAYGDIAEELCSCAKALGISVISADMPAC